MASAHRIFSAAPARRATARSIRTTLRSWAAELAPVPGRWRRAARLAFVTAIGAGLMAAMQLANPLGLTLLVSLAAPEFAFTLATGVAFLLAAAAFQMLMLATVGATADNPVIHLVAFIAFTGVSTYLIYGVPRLGRLWLWIQIPAVTAFYLILFDRRTLASDSAQMFAATAIALLWLFNNLIWPAPAPAILASSLQHTLARSRRRLTRLIAIALADLPPAADRAVASRLAYHLTLLRPVTRHAHGVRAPAAILAAVMIAERIHNELDRMSAAALVQTAAASGDAEKIALREAAAALAAAFDEFIDALKLPPDAPRSHDAAALPRFRQCLSHLPTPDPLARHLDAIANLLSVNPAELPLQAAGVPIPPLPRRPLLPLNKFLVRFSARHTVAMSIAFVAGLYDHSAALQAALWLLMIGGPPSHGATAWKFTMRAVGASGALIFAVLAVILVSPNFTSLPPYMAAIFLGVTLITYLGEGGGPLSFLGIGATAFVIAFSGPGPRPDIVGSLWTIWGISLGLIIRAVISVISIERPNRTLAEEIERPLAALVRLVPDPPRDVAPSDESAVTPAAVAAHQMAVIAGLEEMLDVAADAQLQGPSARIDARNLIDALDSIRRLAFALGNLALGFPELTPQRPPARPSGGPSGPADPFDRALRARLDSWLTTLRAQLEPGQLTPAPLRTMVSRTATPTLPAADSPARQHVALLLQTLDRQLTSISLL